MLRNLRTTEQNSTLQRTSTVCGRGRGFSVAFVPLRIWRNLVLFPVTLSRKNRDVSLGGSGGDGMRHFRLFYAWQLKADARPFAFGECCRHTAISDGVSRIEIWMACAMQTKSLIHSTTSGTASSVVLTGGREANKIHFISVTSVSSALEHRHDEAITSRVDSVLTMTLLNECRVYIARLAQCGDEIGHSPKFGQRRSTSWA